MWSSIKNVFSWPLKGNTTPTELPLLQDGKDVVMRPPKDHREVVYVSAPLSGPEKRQGVLK